jgi:hypothetical protein
MNRIICGCQRGDTKYQKAFICHNPATLFYKIVKSPIKTSTGHIFARCGVHKVHYIESHVAKITREEYIVYEVMSS